MAEDNDIRWGIERRFEFIEWRVYWAGRVNRKDLENEFKISTPQASVDLRRYQEAMPGNIEYDSTAKAYVASSGFRPKVLRLSPERYLLQVHALTAEAIQKSDTWFDEVPAVGIAPVIARGPEAYTLRAILKTISMRGEIDINYLSLTRTGVRTVRPHSLAYDGQRWHARALSMEHGEYRDYVLGRILSVSEPRSSNADPSDDVEWNTFVELKLIAHPKLDVLQRGTIEHDYKMKNGELAVPMRVALAFYFIKRNNLDLRNGEIPPERAQLFLQNFDEVNGVAMETRERSHALVKRRQAKSA